MKFYKIVLALTSFLIIPSLSIAQSKEQQKVDSVFVLVKKHFDLKNIDSLYALTGDKFKSELNAETFKNVCNKQLFTLGKINESSLINFKDHVATYKLRFDVGTLQLLISVDNKDKIEVFLFKPYTANIISGNKKELVATSNPLKTTLEIRIDSIIRQYIQKANTVGLSVSIYNKGTINTYGYGQTSKPGGKLPDANTMYEIGSITKTFTATLLAHYVLEGRIKLTDPIINYLPDTVATNKNIEQITLVELSNHTSGLPSVPTDFFTHSDMDPANPYKNYSKSMLFGYLAHCKLNTPPGEQYAYSNLAVGLLGLILEKVSGKTYEQMVTEIICRPLGLNSTMQHVSQSHIPMFADVYDKDGTKTPVWDLNAMTSAGCLKSTVTDLLAYAKANMYAVNNSLSKAFQLTHKITCIKQQTVGLGWHIVPIKKTEFYFHNGGMGGSSSFLVFNSEKDIAVVVLSNAQEHVDSVGYALTGLLF